MAASEGPDDQPYRMRPSLMYKPGEYREPIFEGLDYLLDAIDRNGMTAVSKYFYIYYYYLINKFCDFVCVIIIKQYIILILVTMNNFWHWSGGFGQYVAWITGNQ